MTIGLLEARFSIPEAFSLKDKRKVVRGLKDRVTSRYNVSAAEVGKHDFWKSAEFAFVTVAGEKKIAEKRLADVLTMIQSEPRLVLLQVDTSYM